MGSSASKDGIGYKVVPNDEMAHSMTHGTGEGYSNHEILEPPASVIQFSSAVYFCEESEKHMTFEIVRLGRHEGEAWCEWQTEDSSAKAGVKYEASGGIMTFAPGEATKEITIRLLDDDAWDATVEFGIVITRVGGAQLGKYLYRTRVKVIDDDVFPTNAYQTKLQAHREREIPSVGLMYQYMKMNMRNPQIRRDSIRQVMLDQLHGMYFVLTLYLQMYLVDIVLAPSDKGELDDGRLLKQTINSSARMLASSWIPVHGLLVPGHRRQTAMVIAAMWVVPFAILHCIDLSKCYLRVPGLARKTLQANLLRRFLNYREDIHAIRSAHGNSDITMAVLRDVHEVVDYGYMMILEVMKIIGKIGWATMFIVAENKMAIVLLAAYPLVLGCFLCCREAKTLRENDLRADRQDEVVQTVSDAINNHRIIADFSLRYLIVNTYEKQIDAFHDQESIAAAVVTNNSYMAPWLTTLSVGLYIVIGAYQMETLGGTLSLGTFLATIHVFKDVGSEMKQIYDRCLTIQRAFGPLRKICHFMNLETDLHAHMRINRMRRKHGEEARQVARKSLDLRGGVASGQQVASFAVDHVQIEIKDVSFQYAVNDPPIMSRINLIFDQGRLYAFVGPPHEGKSTLMKLVGQVLLPPEGGGYIFFPPHLRVLHVSQMFTALTGSLLQNITLHHDLNWAGGLERVKNICSKVGFSPELLRLLNPIGQGSAEKNVSPPSASEEEEIPWVARLSDTDRSRLTLARVFVMNPEAVVFHKPANAFNQYEGQKIIQCIKEFVNERGLELPIHGRPWRRPRTVFFTSSSLYGVNQADTVYRVCSEGIWPIDRGNVDERLLQ